MSHDASNSENNKAGRADLLQSIRHQNLIVVTGAGFSQFASGDPEIDGHRIAGWKGLLAHGYHYCKSRGLQGGDNTEVIDLQLRQNTTQNLLGAAETILNWLDTARASHRHIWLNSSVGKLQLQKPELVQSLGKISPVLFTLNYENLLEQGTGWESLEWKEYDEIARVLRRDANTQVVHLHGFWKNPESIVLDHSSYRDLQTNKPARLLMINLFMYHRMLFIGCKSTFEDPHFRSIIQYLLDECREFSNCHYVLCRNSELADFEKLLKPTKMLKPMVYGGVFEDLPKFIDELAKEAGVVTPNEPIGNQATKPRENDATLNYKKPDEIWRMKWKR